MRIFLDANVLFSAARSAGAIREAGGEEGVAGGGVTGDGLGHGVCPN